MKKMILLAVAMIIVAAANVNGKNVETEKFNSIRVNVPADVRVVRGDSYEVRVKGSSRSLEQSVRLRVENGTLRIDTRDLSALPADARLRITVMVPTDVSVVAGNDMVINTVKEPEASLDMAIND